MPIIDASLFAHIENDAHLAGTYGLEGNHFSVTTQNLESYLNYLKSEKIEFPAEYAFLYDDIHYLVEIQLRLDEISLSNQWLEEINLLGSQSAERILQLAVGEIISLPGGWTNSLGGHKVIYEFIRTTDGYQFRVINSGDGLHYHAKKSSLEKELYNPLKCWIFPNPDSPKQQNELGLFIGRLLKAQLPAKLQKKPVTSKVLYQEILPTISYINAIEIEAPELSDFCYTGGQLSGTCPQRCIHQKIKLKSPSAEKYIRFIFGFKLWTLFVYSEACFNNEQPLTSAVRDQINLAIENNFKILNTEDLFDNDEFDQHYKKLRILQKKLNNFVFDSNLKRPPIKDPVPQLTLPQNLITVSKPCYESAIYAQEPFCKIDLGNGGNLNFIMTQLIESINKISDPATQYYYLEQLILALPINDKEGLTAPFYADLQATKNFSEFATQLITMENLLFNLQNNWLQDGRIPSFHHLFFNLMSLQIDTRYEISEMQNLPSFLPFTNSLMKTIVNNSKDNPYWASNRPDLDRRLEKLQKRFDKEHFITPFISTFSPGKPGLYLYFNALLNTKSQLNQELLVLYCEKYGENITELHQQIRKNNLESLFLISQHLLNKEKLAEKFTPLIETITNHLNFESRLRATFNLYLEFAGEIKPLVILTYSKEKYIGGFTVWTPLNSTQLPFAQFSKKLADYKYALQQSPALKAIKLDLFDHGGEFRRKTRIANSIQLRPPEAKKGEEINRPVTQQDIVARDYCHLRSVPSLQIALTIDYFTRNVAKLANGADQRYVEANLFQPGLLEKALQNPSFFQQFQEFLHTGYRFFNRDGQHRPTSLLFLRLDYLVSRYLYLIDQSAGLPRLQDLQEQLLKQLSLSNDADVMYVQQQYLFLILMTRLEPEKETGELFNLVFSAYAYIQSHSNPNILEDLAHSIELSRTFAKFKILSSQQPEQKITEAILCHLAKSSETKEFEVIKGKFPVYRLSNGNQILEMNAIQGKIFENKLARTSVPYSIKNHPLIKHLCLDKIQDCLSIEDNSYLELNFDQGKVRLFNEINKLIVQKEWFINGQSHFYELKALTKDHLAYYANKETAPLNPSLPQVLRDASMESWQDIDSPENGLLVQNKVPLYLLKSGQIIALDKNFNETAYQLKPISSQWLSLLNTFESNYFIISEVNAENILFKFPRYNLSLETKTDRDKHYLVLKETGEQIIEGHLPIHPAISGFVLSNDRQMRYLVPVQRFYATEESAEKSDFYPLVHDTQGIIANTCLNRHWLKNPLLQKPIWNYQNNEKAISFRLMEDNPVADRVADALYLAYLYLAANQTENAWKTLHDCNTRLGGLTGTPEELQFISWICQDLPFLFEGKKIKKRETPPYVACQLKAMSLLSDFFLQDRKFNLNTPKVDTTANSHYELSQYNGQISFINLFPAMIYQSFKRMQKMRRHLEFTYNLSITERKHLLDFYQQSQPQENSPRGALGYEWLVLNLEFLQQERGALLAREKSGLSRIVDQKRLEFIDHTLKQLKPALAVSTLVEAVEIDLSLPVFPNNQDLTPPGLDRLDSPTLQRALNVLSSDLNAEEFQSNLHIYYLVAYFGEKELRQQLENFCVQTLIANRHISLEKQNSIIPAFSNILYRLLNNPDFVATKINCKAIKYNEVARLPIPPIKVFQAKDIYQKILAKPEEILERNRLPSIPLHNPKITNKSLKIQTGIQAELANTNQKAQRIFEQLVLSYRTLEKEKTNKVNELGKQLTSDLKQQFSIEEAAGKMLFALEKKQKLAAQTLLDSPDLSQLILHAARKLLPPPSDQLSKSWSLALEFANQGPESAALAKNWKIERRAKARAKLGKACLLSIYCQANVNYSVEKTGLNAEKAEQLHQLIHEALFDDIENQTCEKIINKLENALKTKDIDIALQALELLAKEELPGLDTPATMLIQYQETILLRDRQVSAFKNLTQSTKDQKIARVEKIPPGGGKSKVILPVLAEEAATGDNLIVVEVPAASLPTNHVDLNCISQRLFGKRAHRFEFDRDCNCSPKRLERLYQHFTEIMTTRAYLVTTGESVQSLELKYIELLLTEDEKDDNWRKQVFWLDKITELFRHHSLCFIDEAHEGLWLKKKLNYTSGRSKLINPEIFKDATALYNFIDLDFIKQAPNFDINYDWTKFKTELASKLIKEPNSPLKIFVNNACLRYGKDIQATLIDYLLDKGEMSEPIIQASAKDQQSLAFFKQQITKILPETLHRKLNVDYGASRLKNISPVESTLAIPYAGNNAPKENSRFGNELDAINYTIQMMLLKGLSEEHLKARIKDWQALAAKELFQNKDIKTLDDTPTARGFAILDVGCGLCLSQVNVDNPKEMAAIHERHKNNRFLISSLLQEQSWKLIHQDARIYHSDSFNHVDQYADVICITGTPSNHSTFHQRLNYNPVTSLGSDGYILEILNDKNTRLSYIDYQQVSKFIKKAISQSAARERTRAIIDINATFTGQSNITVAKELAAYINKYPSHFSHPLKQVLYFNEEQILCALNVKQTEQSIVLGTSDEKEINLILGSTPQERFTYYDQAHTQGTDLTQAENANALELIDENISLQAYLQGNMRMRLLSQKQTNELIAPTRLSGMKREDLTKQWGINERQLLLVDNLFAAKGQMKNYLRRLLLSHIQDLPSEKAELKAELAQKFKSFFEEIPSLELFALYGAISKKERVSTILNRSKAQLLEHLHECQQSAGITSSTEEHKKMDFDLQGIINKALPLCLEFYDDCFNVQAKDVQIQKQVHKEQQKEQINFVVSFNTKLAEAPFKNWSAFELRHFHSNKDLMALKSKSLNEICQVNKNHSSFFSNTLRVSSNFAEVYEFQEEYLNVFSQPVFLIWYHLKEEILEATIVLPQEVEQIAPYLSKINDSWIATTMDSVIAGNRPEQIIDQENYQAIREQIRFFNGEIGSLLNQETPLHWLKNEPFEKLEFFENHLMAYRPGSETEFPTLKAVFAQGNKEAINYIIKNPFDDLSQFDWKILVPDTIPAQAAEYKKLAELFVYLNKHWLEKDLHPTELQQQFNIPINYLGFIESHLTHLLTIKKLLSSLSHILNHSFSDEETLCFSKCLGISVEDFYKQRDLKKELQLANIEALYLLQSYPALKGKSLDAYLEEFVEMLDLQPEFSFKALQWFGKNIIAHLPLRDMIARANEEECKLLINIESTGPLAEELLFLLAQRCQSKELIMQFVKRSDLNEKVLQVLLANKNLDEQLLLHILKLTKNTKTIALIAKNQAATEIVKKAVYQKEAFRPDFLLSLLTKKMTKKDKNLAVVALLSHPKVNSSHINKAINDGIFSADTALDIITKAKFDDKKREMLVKNLLINQQLSMKSLHTFINTIPEHKNLHQALIHLQLVGIEGETWLEEIRLRHSALPKDNLDQQLLAALDAFKVKACSHALETLNNPAYKEVADTAIELYRKLRKDLARYYLDPAKETFPLKSCRLAIEKAKPVLKVHRGYYQAFVDIFNVILSIITCKCLQSESRSWRFFKVKTESLTILENLGKNLEQVDSHLKPS